jgi:hypothetical protein
MLMLMLIATLSIKNHYILLSAISSGKTTLEMSERFELAASNHVLLV